MAAPKKPFFQRHPGFDLYSLFWLLLFLILAALGRFFLPLWIPAAVVLVYLIIRLLSRYYRHVVNVNSSYISLREEFAHIDDYLKLQQIPQHCLMPVFRLQLCRIADPCRIQRYIHILGVVHMMIGIQMMPLYL